MVQTVTKFVEVSRPYVPGDHQWMADAADPLARAARNELAAAGVAEDSMLFAVKVRLQLASGGPSFDIDAVNYRPDYDWDKHYREAMEAPTSGYARYLSFPGDVAFRIAGQSRGSFKGLWIALHFRQALENAGN